MKTIILTFLCFITFIMTIIGADQTNMIPKESTNSTISLENTVVNRLLTSCKAIQTKFESKLDYTTELKALIDARKTVEVAQLQTAIDYTKQQAALMDQKADKTAMDAFEVQRRAMNARFNELLRLINQVEKNQKTELMPEKLRELITFLEPAASEAAGKETAEAPPKSLLRGAALVKEKAKTSATK